MVSFTGFPDARSFADIEREVLSRVRESLPSSEEIESARRESLASAEVGSGGITEADNAFREVATRTQTPGVLASLIPPPDFRPLPLPPPIGPTLPDIPFLPDVEDLIETIKAAISAALAGPIFRIESTIESVITKFRTPITALQDAFETVKENIVGFVAGTIESVVAQGQRVINTITDKISGAFEGVIGFIQGVIDRFVGIVGNVVGTVQTAIEATISAIVGVVQTAFNAVMEFSETVIEVVGEKISAAIEGFAAAIETSVGVPFAKLADVLPFQVATLGETIQEGLASITGIPAEIGERLQTVLTNLSETLGLDQLLGVFQFLGEIIQLARDFQAFPTSVPEILETLFAGLSVNEVALSVVAGIPFIGAMAATAGAGEYERLQQSSREFVRPSIIPVPDLLELTRRFPQELDLVLDHMNRHGFPDDAKESLFKLRHQLPQVLDLVDMWHRNFIDEVELETRLGQSGWDNPEVALIKQLAFRLPPIQDMILFAIRGVFDIEESREFGEFEGLPSSTEQAFIDRFGIEGGNFQRQVEVFVEQATKLGLPEEWVAAYWTSHWRLPSLQTAYEMFHRLQPDMVEAEREKFIADGFDPDAIKFDKSQLDRLVRASDFSGFWRDKITAIAFNPLTRVDVRRFHKLGLFTREQLVIQYRKIGFAPSDAELMTQFTEAFNAEPDAKQADEVRELTRSAILDFVENEILTPEEGIEALEGIGYDTFAAEAFVEIELANRERRLQRDRIRFVEDRVKAGLIDLNQASVDLDGFGVPAKQKELIVRELELTIAPSPTLPSKTDLDDFLNRDIISATIYRDGLRERGFEDVWIDRFIKSINRLPTRAELASLFTAGALFIEAWREGMLVIGYSDVDIERFEIALTQVEEE